MKNITCNVCGLDNYTVLFRSKDRQYTTDDKLFNVVRCVGCGLIYLNPQPTGEELEKYYPKNYIPHTNQGVFKYGFLSERLKNLYHSYKPRQERAADDWLKDDRGLNYLDFGCGNGSHLKQVQRQHPQWNLFGLDNNKNACQLAKSCGFKVYCGEIEKVNLPTNYFDIVNMTDVIEHLPNPRQSMLLLHKVLKRGGKIIISTPNFDSLGAQVFKSYWFALDTPRHLFVFTPKTLTSLLNATGFNVQKITFKDNLKEEIKSLYYILRKTDLRINPIMWHLLKPLGLLVQKIGKTSVFTIEALKK